MCASDLAAIANSDIVLEAAALHLNTVVLDNSNFFSSYLKLLYNIHESEINWAYGGALLPETLGRNFGEKVAEFWETWFMDS